VELVRIGIIGLPQSGKTSFFRAVTGVEADPGVREVHLGVVHVPDRRVEAIADLSGSPRRTPPEIEFVDMIAMSSDGKAQSDDFVKRIHDADAFAIVVGGMIVDLRSLLRDLDTVVSELIVSDHAQVDARTDRVKREVSRGRKEAASELPKLGVLRRVLDEGRQLRLCEEARTILPSFAGFGFLTAHPALAVFNRPQSLAGQVDAACLSRAAELEMAGLCVDAALERDLLELDPDERELFMEVEELDALAGPRVIAAAFDLLELVTFYTTGDKETRAVPVPRGTTAYEAAGKIHTDMQRGFVRAEVVTFDAFVAGRGWAGAKTAGKFRLEGRDYVMQDGDVAHFRFTS